VAVTVQTGNILPLQVGYKTLTTDTENSFKT